jgi:hypothetical protein
MAPGVTQLHAGGLPRRSLQHLRQFGDVLGDAAGPHLAMGSRGRNTDRNLYQLPL